MSAAPTRAAWDALLAEVPERLAANRRVRRTLPTGGRLHIDRQLPFLVVHRRRPADDAGASRMAASTGSYLLSPVGQGAHARVSRLVRGIVETQSRALGGFLLIELWTSPVDPQVEGPERMRPRFVVHAPRASREDPIVQTLVVHLGKATVRRMPAHATVATATRTAPPGLPRWLASRQARETRCLVLGLEVRSAWADAASGEEFPLVLRTLNRQVSQALHQAFYSFARSRTTHYPTHFHALGRHAMVRAAWEVDGQLAGVSKAFDFLLLCTPINVEQAWTAFRRTRRPPDFRYRPLPIDPVLLKRRLFAVPVERVEDTALDHLFREKQVELDRQLTMLLDRQTRRFLPGSQALYGGVGAKLLATATGLLDELPRSRRRKRRDELDSAGFLRLARDELASYRRQWPRLAAQASVRDDLPAGLLVSQGKLLIGADTRLSRTRADALLQHEIGTHVVTYENGKAQPFQLLAAGLAGYDELQEGLAVMAEYLVGGLTPGRLRVLAARVVGVAGMLAGATFTDTYQLLTDTHGFDRRAAFGITMRIYRAGGLTKDAIYLRGLEAALDYIAAGDDLELLLVGKIAVAHVGLVEELLHRRVLIQPPIRPRYLDREDVIARLRHLRNGSTVRDLIPKD